MFGKFKKLLGGSQPRVNVQERFRILGKSGMGSMSKVFRAQDKKLDKTVCLKILDKEKTAKFEARFAGMQRPSEGAICIDLHHANIIETYEHGLTTSGEQYLIMEWIDGPILHHLIEANHNKLSGNRVEFLMQAAAALAYLHEQKYMHRDICPRNLMLTPQGKVKLIDFGLTIPNRPEFCKPGNRTGTVQYLAPEVIRRQPTDLRVDMYALGITAYELFTRALPWGQSESMETMFSQMNHPPADPKELVPELDEATARFLLKGIAKEPGKRFQTANEFRDTLRQLPNRY